MRSIFIVSSCCTLAQWPKAFLEVFLCKSSAGVDVGFRGIFV